MSMVERVARAIARDDYDGDDLWDEFGPGNKASYTANARAAIEAMREPTEKMSDEGAANNFGKPSYAAWQAMIDAVLLEQQP